MEYKILDELKNWFPAQTADELENLETSLREEGCRDPIVVWNRDVDIVIIDGMTRYPICEKYGIEFSTIEKQFDNIEQVKAWMCRNQLGRRNLSNSQKAYFGARDLWDEESKISHDAIVEGGKVGGTRKNQPSTSEETKKSKPATPVSYPSKPKVPVGETRERIAKIANVGIQTVQGAKNVIERGSQKLNDAVRDGIIEVKPANDLSNLPKEVQNIIVDMVVSGEAKNAREATREYFANVPEDEVNEILEAETDVYRRRDFEKSIDMAQRGAKILEEAALESAANEDSDTVKEYRELMGQIDILERLIEAKICCGSVSLESFVCPECGKSVKEILANLTKRYEEIKP